MMQKALDQADAPSTLLDVRGLTPSGAVKRLRSTIEASDEQRRAWNQQASMSMVHARQYALWFWHGRRELRP